MILFTNFLYFNILLKRGSSLAISGVLWYDRAKVAVIHWFKEVRNLPNIKSAKKRVAVTANKTLQNKMFKTSLKTIIKKYDAALSEGNKDAAALAYKAAVKKIDQAAAKGIIHKNTAARKKSAFALKLNESK